MDRNLRIRMLLEAADKATKPLKDLGASSSRTAKALEKTRDRLREIDRAQANVARFRAMRTGLRDTERQMDETQQRIHRLAREIADTEKPTKALTRDFEAAKRQAQQLTEQHDRETRALQQVREALDRQGVSTRNLVRDERALREEAIRTADALERQTGRFTASQRRREAVQAGRAALDEGVHRATSSAIAGTTAIFEGAELGEVLKKPIESAVELEDKMAAVRKVAQTSQPEIQRMTQDYLRLSQTMPIAVDEFAEMAEKAAAAGVGRDRQGRAMADQRQQIEAFTVQAGKMAVAYNLTKEEAGTTMMAWREAFQLPLPDLIKLGDQVNTLNKYFGGAPAEIDEVLERIGPLGKVAGAQAAQIAAMASSLSSLHVPAEVAATGIKNVLVQFNAGSSATKKLRKAYGELGLDAVDVAKRMQNDAGRTIVDVFTRINRLPKFQQLAELRNMFGKESIAAIAPLLSNLSGLQERLGKVGDATQYAGSVQTEYNIRSNTTAKRLQVAKNNFQDLAITIGADLLPAVNDLAIRLTDATRAITDFANRHPRTIQLAAALVAAIAGLTVAGGVFLLMRAGLLGLAAPFTAINAAAKALDIELLPMYATILAVVAGIALLAGAAYLVYRYWTPIKGFFGGLLDGLVSGFRGALSTVGRLLVDFSPMGLLYRGFAALMSWLGVTMPARLSDAGLYMMQGLARGITNALGMVKSAIVGAADQTMQWFKAKLGIHSPSREFHGFGGFMMAGLANGIDAGRAAPVRRIDALSRQLTSSMSGMEMRDRIGRQARRVTTALAIGAATPAGAGSAGGVGGSRPPAAAPAAPAQINIHIHQAPGQDAKALAKAVRAELERHERAKAARNRSTYTDKQDWD